MKKTPQMPIPCKHIKTKVSKLQAMLIFLHCVERKNVFIVVICSEFLIAWVKLSVFIIIAPPKIANKIYIFLLYILKGHYCFIVFNTVTKICTRGCKFWFHSLFQTLNFNFRALIFTEKTRKDPRRPEKTRKDPKRPEKTHLFIPRRPEKTHLFIPRRPEKTREDPKRPEKTQKDTRKDPKRPEKTFLLLMWASGKWPE